MKMKRHLSHESKKQLPNKKQKVHKMLTQPKPRIAKEDEEIEYLERKLGLKKSPKNKQQLSKELAMDGFGDDILDFLDEIGSKADKLYVNSLNSKQKSKKSKKIEEEEEEEEDEEEEEEQQQQDLSIFDEDVKMFNEEKEPSLSTQPPPPPKLVKEKKSTELKTDIYGRTIGEETHKYIPPHLRKRSDKEVEKLSILRKSVNSLLNKLGDETLIITMKNIIEIYHSNPQNDVNMILTELVIAGIGNDIKVIQSIVRLYSAIISGVSYAYGYNVSGYYLERVYNEYIKVYKQTNEEKSKSKDIEFIYNKKVSNYLLSIVYLYEFECISCRIIFDIIKQLISSFTALDLELLLLCLQTCGFQLRSDDPESLKYIIVDVKDKAKELNTENDKEMSVKSKIILEMIVDLKNNRERAAYSTEIERIKNMKKQIKSISKKSNYIPLNISLEDLQNVDTKGRWWIIGGQWKPDANNNNTEGESLSMTNSIMSTLSNEKKESLLNLAKEMRMNTDIRRSIFVVIMGSEDYMNCFEQLQKLNLNKIQSREVMHVLLDCCGQEKLYNPYYSYLADHLCSFNSSHKFTLKLSFKDFFKEIDNYPSRKIANYAKLLSHMIMKFTLSFGTLKDIKFSNPSKQVKLFLVVLLKDFLGNSSKEVLGQCIARLTGNVDNSVVRNGLVVFIHDTFKEVSKKYPDIHEKTRLMKKLLDEISIFE